MKAVVFDMDGVLFDTERLSISCWMETAQKMGLGDISEGAYGCIGLNRTDSRIFMRGRNVRGTSERFRALRRLLRRGFTLRQSC